MAGPSFTVLQQAAQSALVATNLSGVLHSLDDMTVSHWWSVAVFLASLTLGARMIWQGWKHEN